MFLACLRAFSGGNSLVPIEKVGKAHTVLLKHFILFCSTQQFIIHERGWKRGSHLLGTGFSASPLKNSRSLAL